MDRTVHGGQKGSREGGGLPSPGAIKQGFLDRMACRWVLKSCIAFPKRRDQEGQRQVGKGTVCEAPLCPVWLDTPKQCEEKSSVCPPTSQA